MNTPVISSASIRPRPIVTPRESLPRAKKGIPYAYYTPVSRIYENYQLPRLHGHLPSIRRVASVSHPVSRTRSFVPSLSGRSSPKHLYLPPVENGDSWYTPSVSIPPITAVMHETSAYSCTADQLSGYPLPPAGMERSDNIYQLPPDILHSVAFLSELTNPLDVPAGLRLPKSDMHEVPYAKALKDPITYPRPALTASVAKEVSKLTDRYQALQLVTDSSQIEPDALFINGILLSKVKYLADGAIDRISTRFALNGTLQKEDDYGETYAATPDEAAMICCMSAFQAHAIKHNYVQDLEYESFDVEGAFLHVDLVSKRQIITRLPQNIDHPLAGRMFIVKKSVYGLRQSNKAFADDFSATMLSAGFSKTIDPCIF